MPECAPRSDTRRRWRLGDAHSLRPLARLVITLPYGSRARRRLLPGRTKPLRMAWASTAAKREYAPTKTRGYLPRTCKGARPGGGAGQGDIVISSTGNCWVVAKNLVDPDASHSATRRCAVSISRCCVLFVATAQKNDDFAVALLETDTISRAIGLCLSMWFGVSGVSRGLRLSYANWQTD